MNDLIEFYLATRGSIFTGFLTAGSFLLTMKVFMITTMKEKYYDQDFYDKILTQHRENDPKIDRYEKLHQFRKVLKASIYACYITSLLQLVVGPFIVRNTLGNGLASYSGGSLILSIGCLLAAIFTIILVLICIHALSCNMKMYVTHSKSEKK